MPALRVLFGPHDPERERRAERCRAALSSGGHDPGGLSVTRDAAGKVCGAVLAQAMPGALGVVWPPHADTPAEENALARAACDWLRGRGVKVCQAFATAADVPDMGPLERNGFRHVTQLVFMRRELDPPPDVRGEWVEGQFYRDRVRDLFAEVLLATHAGTLDCPELNGGRTDAELAAGFELPDRMSMRYFLAELDGRPAGVVFTEPAADRTSLDLTYLGVVPSARGRGYGGRLLRWVLCDASRSFPAVTLSVDARNEPALRLYRRHGFAETDRREVWLAQL